MKGNRSMKKKRHLIRNTIFFLALSIILLVSAYYLYNTYNNIEITSEYDVSKLNSSNNEQSLAEKESNVSEMLEDVSSCVV